MSLDLILVLSLFDFTIRISVIKTYNQKFLTEIVKYWGSFETILIKEKNMFNIFFGVF